MPTMYRQKRKALLILLSILTMLRVRNVLPSMTQQRLYQNLVQIEQILERGVTLCPHIFSYVSKPWHGMKLLEDRTNVTLSNGLLHNDPAP